MNSINTIDPLENLKLCTMKMVGGKTDTHMGHASFHLSKTVMDYVIHRKKIG